ncbi:MAG: glycosyltransferase family 4 protein [Actinomycetales bacterium]|nr:glycosyltransferase family 4 protein [Actinomycetales bacterium]
MTERAPRILVLVGPATGGIGAHAAALSAGVADRGGTVAVVCPGLTAERFTWRVPVVLAWPGGGLLEVWRRWRRLRELVATADVVHAHGHQAGLLALAAARGTRPRPAVVVSWHNAVLATGARRAVLALGERLQARRADLVTGASLDLVERATALGAGGAELAPVASPRAGHEVPDGARERIRTELGLDERALVALTVSRIAPQKRLDVLLDAATLLAHDDAAARRVGAPVTWLVAGDGDANLDADLRARAAASGADVRFLGARSDVPELLAAADLFVLTSRWEARALVVQEAMAAGVPVVATAVGGLPELVGDAGILVREGDALGLATAVGDLLAAPRRRDTLAEAARRRFAALPGESDITRSWWTRYARLARAARGLR